MILVCIRKFGNTVPGDEVEVPDGAAFDHYHFEVAEAVDDSDDNEDEDE